MEWKSMWMFFPWKPQYFIKNPRCLKFFLHHAKMILNTNAPMQQHKMQLLLNKLFSMSIFFCASVHPWVQVWWLLSSMHQLNDGHRVLNFLNLSMSLLLLCIVAVYAAFVQSCAAYYLATTNETNICHSDNCCCWL